jgi:hypothetical protein
LIGWAVLSPKLVPLELSDELRLGRPRIISNEQVNQVITATLEQAPPGGDTH